jgi:hypothetical protein
MDLLQKSDQKSLIISSLFPSPPIHPLIDINYPEANRVLSHEQATLITHDVCPLKVLIKLLC